jgi:hypothetical protein
VADFLRFVPGYEHHVYGPGREPVLFLLLAFLFTFAAVGTYTRVRRLRGWGSGSVRGVHLHHLRGEHSPQDPRVAERVAARLRPDA